MVNRTSVPHDIASESVGGFGKLQTIVYQMKDSKVRTIFPVRTEGNIFHRTHLCCLRVTHSLSQFLHDPRKLWMIPNKNETGTQCSRNSQWQIERSHRMTHHLDIHSPDKIQITSFGSRRPISSIAVPKSGIRLSSSHSVYFRTPIHTEWRCSSWTVPVLFIWSNLSSPSYVKTSLYEIRFGTEK